MSKSHLVRFSTTSARLKTDVRDVHEKQSNKLLCVGLLGPYSSRNLGDTAIQLAVIENLRKRSPALSILGISPDPRDTMRCLNVAAFPLDGRGTIITPADSDELLNESVETACAVQGSPGRWRAVYRIANCVRSLNLLIISGGGQLDDFWGGAWKHPFMLLIWASLARLYGVRVAFAGVGMDRLASRLSRLFAISALRLAHHRSFRDVGTLTIIRSLGLRAPSQLCPDLAFSLGLNLAQLRPPIESQPFVVVNPVSEKTWAHNTDSRHDLYLKNLAATCEWMCARKLHVHIVCSQETMDRMTANRLAEMLRPTFSDRVKLCDAPQVLDFLSEVHAAQVVIASRLHGAILSLLAGVPVIAISPLRKLAQLMEGVGLANYTLELQNFTSAELIDLVTTALNQRSKLRRQVRDRNLAFRNDLSRIYDDILALV